MNHWTHDRLREIPGRIRRGEPLNEGHADAIATTILEVEEDLRDGIQGTVTRAVSIERATLARELRACFVPGDDAATVENVRVLLAAYK